MYSTYNLLSTRKIFRIVIFQIKIYNKYNLLFVMLSLTYPFSKRNKEI